MIAERRRVQEWQRLGKERDGERQARWARSVVLLLSWWRINDWSRQREGILKSSTYEV
jgi:hypothetical protein